MIWFTSDPHYYHKNVIPYCKRPFKDIEEMHEELIKRWHEKVKDGDVVLILGDFAFCGVTKGQEIIKRLRGDKKIHITCIKGNHDPKPGKLIKMGFDQVAKAGEFGLGFDLIKMSHFPYAPTKWERFTYKVKNFWKFWRWLKYKELRYMNDRPIDDGSWLLHGHVHTSWKFKRKMINVGVDVWDYYPVSLKELQKVMNEHNSA